jgi:hydrogenase-4 component B
LGLLSVPLAIIALYGGNKAGRRTVQDPWTCGYGYAIQMSITASSFDQPVKATFRILYALRTLVVKPFAAVGRWSRRAREIITRSEPVLEAIITRPTARAVEYLGRQIQVLQMGDIRMYCLYIIFTLAVLLVVIFR